jgi:hypothetical protein
VVASQALNLSTKRLDFATSRRQIVTKSLMCPLVLQLGERGLRLIIRPMNTDPLHRRLQMKTVIILLIGSVAQPTKYALVPINLAFQFR